MKSTVKAGAIAALLVAVLAAYANHFRNDFHYDDIHSITGNVYVQELRNIPRFFTDPMLSSTMPDHAMYRPVVTASLAVDYRLGRGYQPFFFHLSTFVWFALQLVLMVFLFERLTGNFWIALAAAACYGLHPANAETVNYIIQRAEVYSTLGVVASLLWFIARPEQRRWGLYLIPAVLAFFSKAPALIFPLILLAYLWFFERHNIRSVRTVLPPFAVTIAAAIFTAKITPSSFQGGAASAALYRITQPWVALHYFVSFFVPTQLSANSDWTYIQPFSVQAIAGYLFVAGLGALIWFTSKRSAWRPVAFGLAWFLLALIPTSLTPLAEVTNDHRMYFPFVGLALAVVASLAKLPVRVPVMVTAGLALAVLSAEAAGTHVRNEVWRSEESLWHDVTIKSPKDGVGMMNYGIALFARNDFTGALPYLQHADELMPNYYSAAINLGLAYSGLGRDAEAVKQFERAESLAPSAADPYFYYGRWLKGKGRLDEAQAKFETTLKVNPNYFQARSLLIEVYTAAQKWRARDHLIVESLHLTHNDELAQQYMKDRSTPESLLRLSAKYCNQGNYLECLGAAQEAIELRPDYAEAYSNVAAAYIAMRKWDEGIQAAREALRLKPGYDAAQSNLEWALSHRK